MNFPLYSSSNCIISFLPTIGFPTLLEFIPLAEIKQYARKSCSFCDDFSSELADISAGGLELDKWTFIIIRTEKGEKLFADAEKAKVIKTRDVKEEPNALSLLHKLSNKKRQNMITR